MKFKSNILKNKKLLTLFSFIALFISATTNQVSNAQNINPMYKTDLSFIRRSFSPGEKARLFDITSGTGVSSTYNNQGYEVVVAPSGVVNLNAVEYVDFISIDSSPNSSVWRSLTNLPGLKIVTKLEEISDGAYGKISFNLKNEKTDSDLTLDLAVASDIQIGNDDMAPVTIEKINGQRSSIKMKSRDGVNELNIHTRNFYGVTDVDTLWIGSQFERHGKYFEDSVEDYIPEWTDSGMAFSWKNINLKPQEEKTFSFIVKIGGANAAPNINSNNNLKDEFSPGETISLDGLLGDLDGDEITIKFAINDGPEQTINGSFSPPGSNMIPYTISFELPNDLTPGNHNLKIWAVDSKGAISIPIEKNINIIANLISSNNIDIYIKPQNVLSLNLNTNSVSFEDFNGVNDMIKNNAITLTVESILPYELNAYLESEITNNDKTKTMDKRILGIKTSQDSQFKSFTDINTKMQLLDVQSPARSNIHEIDLMLRGNIPYETDVYKTIIKFEINQK